MMGSFGTCVLTDAGRSLLADVLASEDTLVFTRFVIGNGEYDTDDKTVSKLKTMTALKSVKEHYGLSYGERTEPETVRLSVVISNVDMESHTPLFDDGFHINEIGLLARAGTSNQEILYAIAVTALQQGDYFPAYDGSNPTEIMQDILVAVTNETSIHVEYDSGVYAKATDLVLAVERIDDLENDVDDISDDIQIHGSAKINSETGSHGFRFLNGIFYAWNVLTEEWDPVFSDRTLIFQDVSITVSTWQEDDTYSGYPYKAEIVLTGVTAGHVPSVCFSLKDAESGNFAPVAESLSGKVVIYAKNIPEADLLVPTILCEKGE